MSGIPDYSGYSVSRPNGPPPPRRRKFPLLSTQPGAPTILRPLQAAVVMVNTHYLPDLKRTIFCGGTDGGCAVDHDCFPVRWAGYLLCERMSVPGGVVIWHVSPGCATQCPALLDATRSLVNARIETNREGKTNRSPVAARVSYAFFSGHLLKESFDLFDHLVGIYGSPNNEGRRNKRHGSDGMQP